MGTCMSRILVGVEPRMPFSAKMLTMQSNAQHWLQELEQAHSSLGLSSDEAGALLEPSDQMQPHTRSGWSQPVECPQSALKSMELAASGSRACSMIFMPWSLWA